MTSGDLVGGAWSRKGLRETGLGGAGTLSKGDAGDAGDVARLRKGLFEERFRLRPADCCESRKYESEADMVRVAVIRQTKTTREFLDV